MGQRIVMWGELDERGHPRADARRPRAPRRWSLSLFVFVLSGVLTQPFMCWTAECPAAAPACREAGCDNLLGMTFDGLIPVGLIVGSLLGGLTWIAWSVANRSDSAE